MLQSTCPWCLWCDGRVVQCTVNHNIDSMDTESQQFRKNRSNSYVTVSYSPHSLPSFQSTSTQFTFLIVTMSLSLRYREWSWQWQINCGNKMLEKGRVNTFKVKFSFVSSRGSAGVSAPLYISCSRFASHCSARWLGINRHLNRRKKKKNIHLVTIKHAYNCVYKQW